MWCRSFEMLISRSEAKVMGKWKTIDLHFGQARMHQEFTPEQTSAQDSDIIEIP